MNEESLKDEVLVRSQETPNPMALKFIVSQPLKATGKATFRADSNHQGLKLIESLFEIEGAEQVYLQGHTLTFTHNGTLMSSEIQEYVDSIIRTRWPVHNIHFEVEEDRVQKKQDRSHLSEQIREIEEILDRTIRPGLQADGGDLEVIRYEDDELHIMYQGACGGCPSAMMGTLDAIQSILSQELDQPNLRVYPI